jgi:glycosyltransferase involved in cell wall biosynthesis
MNIVHYIIGFYNPPQGGVEVAVRDIAKMTPEHNHIVLCTGSFQGKLPYLESRPSIGALDRWHGWSTHCFSYRNQAPFVPEKSTHFDSSTIQRIKQEKPDVLIIYAGDCGAMLIPLLEPLGCKKIVRVQGGMANCAPFEQEALSVLRNYADVVVTFKDNALKYYQTNNIQTVCIPKAYDDTYFNLNGRSDFIGTRYLYVGRDSQLKNVDKFVELFKRYAQHDETLYMVGGANNNPHSFARFRSHNIFTQSWVSQKELSNFYKQSDFVILPSFLETFSSTALEAMASGCILVINNRTMPWTDGLCINGASFVSQENYPDINLSNPQGLNEALQYCITTGKMAKYVNLNWPTITKDIASTVHKRYSYSTVQSLWKDIL